MSQHFYNRLIDSHINLKRPLGRILEQSLVLFKEQFVCLFSELNFHDEIYEEHYAFKNLKTIIFLIIDEVLMKF